MGDGIDELRAAERARRRHTTLLARLRTAETHRAACVAAAAAAAEAGLALGDEQADVDRLSSLSLGRIVAALQGDREARLEREQVEVRAAEHARATALERLRVAQAQVASVEDELAALGDVEAMERAAVALRERALRVAGGETAERLGEVAREIGTVQARFQEYDEALAAAAAASSALAEAADRLGGAQEGAVLGGGGLLTDSSTYERFDEAGRRLRDAGAALAQLSRELSDVEVSPAPGLQLAERTRTLDAWFDGVLSGWAVRDRVEAAAAAVATLRGRLDRLFDDLGTRRAREAALLAALEEERLRLLEF